MIIISWKEVTEQNNGTGDKKELNYVKLSVGHNPMRILDDEPISFWSHWIQAANGGKGMSLMCIGKDCPGCDSIKYDKINKIQTKNKTSRKHAINVWNRKTKRVEILEKGKTIFESLAIYLDSMGDLKDYDIDIVQTGEGFGNVKYTVMPIMKSESLPDEAKDVYDLSEIYKPMSKEMMILIMNGKTIDEARKELGLDDDVVDINEVDFTKK